MPRKPRFFLPGIPAHIVQRGHNRQVVFLENLDFLRYISLLEKARERYACEVHAYVLMTNHVHLLVTPSTTDSISGMMQYIGRQYVPYFNSKYSRTGTLWEGRFKASIVDTSHYLLACYRYIEMNPVRAGLVSLAGEYLWSSYPANARGDTKSFITPHPGYLSLGNTPDSRRKAYKELFVEKDMEIDLPNIREHLQSGTPLGSDLFREEIEKTLKQSVGQVKRGGRVGPKYKGVRAEETEGVRAL